MAASVKMAAPQRLTFHFPPQHELSGRSCVVPKQHSEKSVKVAASSSFLPQPIASKMLFQNC